MLNIQKIACFIMIIQLVIFFEVNCRPNLSVESRNGEKDFEKSMSNILRLFGAKLETVGIKKVDKNVLSFLLRCIILKRLEIEQKTHSKRLLY
jgi:hypothetical protein